MIELLTANTPNGKKISIMLEEINFDYKLTKIDINKDEQFRPEFIKIMTKIYNKYNNNSWNYIKWKDNY